MSNSYFGDSSSSSGGGRSGSSRKGKKSNPDKPKQPQRGLGVAQLEKLRLENQMGGCYLPSLHGQPHTNFHQEEDFPRPPSTVPLSSSYSSSSSYGYQSNMMMGYGDMETTDIRYSDSHSSGTARTRWNQAGGVQQHQEAVQPHVTRQFFSLQTEDSTQKKRRHDRCDSMGSSGHYSDSSDMQELDLDLKL
ncbi:hypothetical protein ACLOJK_021179 [Asimina triloba]